jgi:hypothetical protein
MILIGTPAVAIAALVAVRRAADRGPAVAAAIVAMLEIVGLAALLLLL